MNDINEYNCIDKDELLLNTKLNIDKFGLQVIMVGSTSYCPSFAYSIGLTKSFNHPEIICFGLPNDLGHAIINDIAELIRNGETFKAGNISTNIFQNSKAAFINVDKRNIKDYFGAALNYYEDSEFDALQVVWTDRNDNLPWEDNFEDEFRFQQPLLDRNADFKFYEPENLTVFTTRQCLEENKPILRVVHEANGDWQFLTGDQLTEDIRIIALSELVKMDNSLNQIFDLEYGEVAERDEIGGNWTRKQLQLDEDTE